MIFGRYNCKTCGRFGVTVPALNLLQLDMCPDKPLLSAVARTHVDPGQQNPRVFGTSEVTNPQETLGIIRPPVSERLRRLVLHLGGNSSGLGEAVHMVRWHDWPLFWMRSGNELLQAVAHLADAGIARTPTGAVPSKPTTALQLSLTALGCERVEVLESGRGQARNAFVAMSFHPSMDSVWSDGISPALSDCGFIPRRVDKEEHNGKICDKIIAEIRAAGFLVADFSMHRAGVYFEAGFAMGLGKPVIWTCSEQDIAGAHFDTRQYNHVVWTDPEDLRDKLVARIRATIVGSH